jgi:hypothetical protein
MEILTKRRCFCSYFLKDRRATVDDEDEILQIMAREEVAVPATFERFRFRGQEVRRGDNPDLQIRRQLVCDRGFHGGAIPAIGKSENRLIQGHDVEDSSRANPPAQGRSFTRVLRESEHSKAFAEGSVLRVSSDFSNCVHSQRRPRCARAFISDKQTRYSASHKHQVLEHWPQERGCRNKLLKIRIRHWTLSIDGAIPSGQSCALEHDHRAVRRQSPIACRKTRLAEPLWGRFYIGAQARHRAACLPHTARQGLGHPSGQSVRAGVLPLTMLQRPA